MIKPCAVDGCDRQAYCRGWCAKHYQRWKAHGDPTKTTRRPRASFDPGDPLDPRHGVNGYHNLGCRCPVCRAANTVYHAEGGYQREYRDRHLAGKPCATEGCACTPDRSYVTGYCHRCNIKRGLKPDPADRIKST
jgi:hypothetical protein